MQTLVRIPSLAATLLLAAAAAAQLPDLTITRFDTTATRFVAGHEVTVGIGIENLGTTRSAACQLTVTAIWSGGRRQLLTTSDVPAISRSKYTQFRRFRLPVRLLGEGTAIIQAKVDSGNVVTESNEGNNTRGFPITTERRADLVATSLVARTRRWENNRSYSFTVTLKNEGQLSAGPFEASLLLSIDDRITVADTPLARVSIGSLAANAARTLNLTGRIPANWPAGPCWIGFYVDTRNRVTEAREDNNLATVAGVRAVSGRYLPFGSGCGRSVRPTQVGMVVPRVGGTMTMQVRNALPTGPVLTWIGGSKDTWGSIALPLDLGPLGFPGCGLLVRPDASIPSTADGSGTARLSFLVPIDLDGQSIYFQSVAIGTTPTQIGMSAGLQALIGN